VTYDDSDLQDILLAASRFEVARRQGALANPEDAEAVAQRAATNALRTVRSRLNEFRGQSEFSTWASKFALVETARAIRCRDWRDREVAFETASWDLQPDPENDHRLRALREAIQHDLTRRQREALVATAINAVPIDVVAERLGTSRNAVYESIHSARKALRAALTERGLGRDQYAGSESS
jgi:RNA polymerase sigma-70 factor (ECF subfamily)